MKMRKSIALLLVFAVMLSMTAAAATYTVAEGDRLWKIANAHGVTWQEIAEVNDLDDANMIYVGQELTIPSDEAPVETPAEETTEAPAEETTEEPAEEVVEETPAPPADTLGIGRVMVSVTDLEESREFYEESMELEFVAEGELTAEQVKALFGLEGGARYVMLKNEIQITYLQLIEFEARTGELIREGWDTHHYGYFDIAFRAMDAFRAYDYFTPLGYEFFCPPTTYKTPWSGVEVKESIVYGPDMVPLALIEGSNKSFEGEFHNFTDIVTVVSDIEESDRFFVDVLGLSKVFDMTMPHGLVDDIVGVEYGVDTRIIMYVGGKTPVVELLQYENKPGVSMKEHATPEKAGLFNTAFEVDNIYTTLGACEDAGFPVEVEPFEYELAPYGTVKSAVVAGPDGTIVEIFEVMD